MQQDTLFLLLALGLCTLTLAVIFIATRKKSSGKTERELAQIAAALARLDQQASQDASQTRRELLSQLSELSGMALRQSAQSLNNTLKTLESMRETMDRKLREIGEQNRASLDAMRQTVDQKLSETVSAGLEASFLTVSTQLDQVSKSMGEMRVLTGDILDLKQVLAGVKTRGNWGELQLEQLLCDILSPELFEKQFSFGVSRGAVDFAIRLPGRGREPVYLPVDAKFPFDKYAAVVEAQNRLDRAAEALAAEALVKAVREEAKSIRQKYICPPSTTDFAVLFVPSEGLYAYLASQGLLETLHSEFKILLSGPSTFPALLNILRMGFRSVAIEQRAVETQKLLFELKRNFGTFSDNLLAVRKSIEAAANNLDRASASSRSIERRLKSLEGPEEEPVEDDSFSDQ